MSRPARPRLAFALACALVALVALAAGCAPRPGPTAEQPAPGQPAGELTHSPGALAVVGADIGALPTDEASLLAGRRLYVTHCVSCHGAAGQGDDLYAAQSGQPMPDLARHMAPGVHSDGQILAYIRDGISGTSMPGYGLLLSEAEQLQLTAYLRTFGQESPLVGVDPDALATEQARPPTPTPIPDAQEPLPALVFIRDNNVWRSGGSEPAAPLTDLGPNGVAQNPAVAPDGRRVAFAAIELPSGATDTITSTLQLIDGAGPPRVLMQSTTEQLRHPAWAPDGSALYITVSRGEPAADGSYTQQTDVVRVDPATGAAELFLPGARDLTVSADGRLIAYVRMRADGTTAGLAVAAPNGGAERALIPEGAFEELAAPRFSPDGSRLLVAARGEPLADLPGARPTDGGSPIGWLRELLAPPAAMAHGTPWDIWSVDVGGGEIRRLTSLFEDEPHAVFSPDGREIALLGLGGIYRMDSDGGRLRRVDPVGSYGGLDWPPR